VTFGCYWIGEIQVLMAPMVGLLPPFHCWVCARCGRWDGQETQEIIGFEEEGLAELLEVLLESRQ
jgi:hypothetical protein